LDGIFGLTAINDGLKMTESQDELIILTNEVFRRVGRNLYNFQKVEQMLKFLVANGNINGPAKELKELQKTLADSLHKLTMGQMAGRFMEDILSDAGDIEDESEVITETWFSFKMRFVPTDPLNTELNDGLRSVVEERNNLVHHMLSHWDKTSLESTNTILKQLDEQREKLIPVYQQLMSMVQDLENGRKATADFLGSTEGKQALELAWLQQSPTVRLLSECVKQLGRMDGWLPLATAAHVIRQHEPEDVTRIKERYGYSTLKQLVIASQMFDIQDEPTTKGFRTVYRLKAEAADTHRH